MTVAPLVSVVTPTRNQGRFIADCLESVRSQTYSNVEHIVVDGGSTDDTLAVLERYSETYQFRWNSEPDGGMYEAINKGMQLATGQILAYLNSDDLYLPWAIEAVVDAFKANPRAGLVYGDAIRRDDMLGVEYPMLQTPFVRRFTVASGSLIQPAVFWRREVGEDVGAFDERLRFVADLDFWLRSSQRKHRFVRVHEFLAVDRVHPEALSTAQFETMEVEHAALRASYDPNPRQRAVWRKVAHAWSAAAFRTDWLLFAAALLLGHPRRWHRLIAACRPAVSLRTFARTFVPDIGRRGTHDIRWKTLPSRVAGSSQAEDLAQTQPRRE